MKKKPIESTGAPLPEDPPATAAPPDPASAPPAAAAAPWLGTLEERVHQAVREIASLRDRNAALEARIDGLVRDYAEAEERAARAERAAAEAVAAADAARAAASGGAGEGEEADDAVRPLPFTPPPAPAPDPELERWRAEREEIRARVARLVGTLETLLAETAEEPVGVQASLEG